MTIVGVTYEAPDPQWYLDNVLIDAEPGGPPARARGPVDEWRRWWHSQVAGPDHVRVAAEQGFVLATADLARFGISRSRARTEVRHRRWRAPAVGVVAPIDPADPSPWVTARRDHALCAAAAALRRHGGVVTGRSAAIVHGLPTLHVPQRPELLTPAGAGAGVVHRFAADVHAAECTEWFGMRVTDAARTVVDVARHDRREGVIVADAALRERLVDRARLSRALARAGGWPGVRRARDCVAFADPRSESPLESLIRLALADDGFPPPQLQYVIGPYRVDFCWPELRLVLEADGRVKYGGGDGWAEKRRETALRRFGVTIERVLWHDATAGWPAFSAYFRRYF